MPRRTVDLVLAAVITMAVAGSLVSLTQEEAERERKAACMSNLKEMAVALQIYWNDYDATLPSSAVVSRSPRWKKTDFTLFATKVGALPARGKKQTLMQVLYESMKSKDTMFCPSDPVDRKNPASQGSYWWKCAIDKAWYGVGCAKPCMKEVDFAYNADQVAFYEHNGWHFGQTNGLRNGTQINVAYLDTHVRTVRLRNATSGKPVNCAANTNGEPMYFNFDNNRPAAKDVNPPRERNATCYIDPSRYGDRY